MTKSILTNFFVASYRLVKRTSRTSLRMVIVMFVFIWLSASRFLLDPPTGSNLEAQVAIWSVFSVFDQYAKGNVVDLLTLFKSRNAILYIPDSCPTRVGSKGSIRLYRIQRSCYPQSRNTQRSAFCMGICFRMVCRWGCCRLRFRRYHDHLRSGCIFQVKNRELDPRREWIW